MGYPELSTDERKRRLAEIYEQQKILDEERRFYEKIGKEESDTRLRALQRSFIGKYFKGYSRSLHENMEWLLIFDINETNAGIARCVAVYENGVSLVERDFLRPKLQMKGIPDKDYYNPAKWVVYDCYKEISAHEFLEEYIEFSDKIHDVIDSVNQYYATEDGNEQGS